MYKYNLCVLSSLPRRSPQGEGGSSAVKKSRRLNERSSFGFTAEDAEDAEVDIYIPLSPPAVNEHLQVQESDSNRS